MTRTFVSPHQHLMNCCANNTLKQGGIRLKSSAGPNRTPWSFCLAKQQRPAASSRTLSGGIPALGHISQLWVALQQRLWLVPFPCLWTMTSGFYMGLGVFWHRGPWKSITFLFDRVPHFETYIWSTINSCFWPRAKPGNGTSCLVT